MPWHARLRLHYTAATPARTSARTVARFEHDGPLRILQSLYPEGDAVCHNVMVHPPSGLVGGDVLDIDVQVDPGAHGLLTTPGATRFYRSEGETALQATRLRVAAGGRLEWLPLEAICYDGCQAENRLRIELAPGAEMMGWDIAAFGLPGARKPFTRGRLLQHIEAPGAWLERGLIDAADTLLMDGALGLAGHRCCAALFFVAGSPIERGRRQALLEVAQDVAQQHGLAATAGATSPDARLIVLRVLAPVVEPAAGLLQQVWSRWRSLAWALPAVPPRIWAT
ncbi:MAG: urease accessory protein UreD [Comamonas sp.]